VDAPVLLNTIDFVLLSPTCTLPKLRLAGLALRVPGAAVPVPDSGTLKLGLVASLVMVKAPLALPTDAGAKTTLNVLVAPAAKVRGRVRPFTLKLVPVAEAWLMVTLDPPEFVKVSCNVLLEPVCTEPKPRLELLGESVPGVTPVPESVMASAPLEASLVMERLPLALPPEAGLKTTLKDAVLPAAIAKGRFRPLKLNPVPLRVAWVTVTSEPPVFDSVSEIVWLFPTTTLPKLRLELLAASDPGVVAVPESGTVNEELEAVLVMVRLLLVFPPDAGPNTTLKEMLLPASTVAGKDRPVTVNPVPEAEAWLMVTLLPPELVRVSERVLLEPVCTDPKLKLEGFAISAPAVTPDPDSVHESGEPELGVRVTLPDAFPADCGAKVTLTVALCPAATVTGVLIPLRLKPVPVTEA
jgi:hypothetical protein